MLKNKMPIKIPLCMFYSQAPKDDKLKYYQGSLMQFLSISNSFFLVSAEHNLLIYVIANIT